MLEMATIEDETVTSEELMRTPEDEAAPTGDDDGAEQKKSD